MGEAALVSHARLAKPGKNPTKHQRLDAERNKAVKSLSVLHFAPSDTNRTEERNTTEESLIAENPDVVLLLQPSSQQSTSSQSSS